MGALGTIDQKAYRFRNDDGSEVAATWAAALDTGISLAPAVVKRVRILLQSQAGANNNTNQWQYQLNGDGWNNITTSSAVVKATNSPNITDAEVTTQQLGSGTFAVGEVSEDALCAVVGITAPPGETEHELVFELVGADVVTGDVVEIRGSELGTQYNVYTATPTITVTTAPNHNVGTAGSWIKLLVFGN